MPWCNVAFTGTDLSREIKVLLCLPNRTGGKAEIQQSQDGRGASGIFCAAPAQGNGPLWLSPAGTETLLTLPALLRLRKRKTSQAAQLTAFVKAQIIQRGLSNIDNPLCILTESPLLPHRFNISPDTERRQKVSALIPSIAKEQ